LPVQRIEAIGRAHRRPHLHRRFPSIRRGGSPFVDSWRTDGEDAARLPSSQRPLENAMERTAALESSSSHAHARDVTERLRARSRAVGALVMTGFGAWWAVLGAAATGSAMLIGCAVALIAVALALAAVRLRRANPVVSEPLPADVVVRLRRGKRIFAWALAAEVVGIPLAINLVVDLGHPQWQTSAIMGVVGVHFLPLASGFRYRPHLVTGVAMTAWALAYPGLFAAGGLSPIGPLVGGAMLFASAAWALRPA
jgi:hypothetical protein